MSDYYIKHIWGPAGQQQRYPYCDQAGKAKLDFNERQEKATCRFSECKGFLIYETSHKGGAKTIYARGVIDSSEVLSHTVKVRLNMRVNPLNGVSLGMIRKIIGKPKATLQGHGGLFPLTEDQFDALSSELDKCLKRK